MRDFTEEELDPLTTLGQQYEKRIVRMLRLYLSCKKNESDINETIDASASNTESENARAVESESPHASAYETAWAVRSSQGTALM